MPQGRNGDVSVAIRPGPPWTSAGSPEHGGGGLITAGLPGGAPLSVAVPAALAYSAGTEASRNFNE
jgi:hypothetical protein